MAKKEKQSIFKKFPAQFWLVVTFEFFERGSYYGMMSILSVYLTDTLFIPKESVGLIKGVIQPLLYFLPIISGALADRFGYRRTLMVAFALLGTGYFLAAQATEYTYVFGALVVMGFGAGAFKPVISGTIARVTDEKNSTLGFGIFYWSINMGAFLFPLILVPFLKAMNPAYVILAAAVGTAAMLIPTIFLYKEPHKNQDKNTSPKTNLFQTLANAFEIIYSPIVLLFELLKSKTTKKIILSFLILGLLIYGLTTYLQEPQAKEKYSSIGINKSDYNIVFNVNRNMSTPEYFKIDSKNKKVEITILKPDYLEKFGSILVDSCSKIMDSTGINISEIEKFIKMSNNKISIAVVQNSKFDQDFGVHQKSIDNFIITLNNIKEYNQHRDEIYTTIQSTPILAGILQSDIDSLVNKADSRSFFILFLALILCFGIVIIAISNSVNRKSKENKKPSFTLPTIILILFGLIIFIIPGVSILGKSISYVIFITLSSLFIIDKSSPEKFKDHAKFLLMIMLYSGFWIMYFQMFDSVLWYVQAYVDATGLNSVVNNFLGIFGIKLNWFFDVEHVTVINAGTIILLQLFISNLVKNTKALPTMIVGISVATIGMAILAVSANIWVFIIGITLFSIGEMTTHPKFISYIGLIAPSDKKAMYMGYLFLYGVFGSSVGGIIGAKLYVHFVDNLNQPKTLWLIFSSIGIATIISLLLYNKFLAPKKNG